MSCVVYIKNKKTGQLYAYKSESYRDPKSKKPRTKRTYLGRVDSHGNIVPKAAKGRRNTAPVDATVTPAPVQDASNAISADLVSIKKELLVLSQQIETIMNSMQQMTSRQQLVENAFGELGQTLSPFTRIVNKQKK